MTGVLLPEKTSPDASATPLGRRSADFYFRQLRDWNYSAEIEGMKADRDYHDPRCAWQRQRQIAGDGAIVVRPDRFIAWRPRAAKANPGVSVAWPVTGPACPVCGPDCPDRLRRDSDAGSSVARAYGVESAGGRG